MKVCSSNERSLDYIRLRGGKRNKEGSGGKDGVSRDGGEREGVTERETDEGIKNIHNLLGMHL